MLTNVQVKQRFSEISILFANYGLVFNKKIRLHYENLLTIVQK